MAEKKIGSHILPNSAVSLLYGLAAKVEAISKKRYRITKGEEHILQLLVDSAGLSDPTIVNITNRFFDLIPEDAHGYIQSKLPNPDGMPEGSETPEGFQTITYRGKNKLVFRPKNRQVNDTDSKKSQVLYRGRRIAE